MKQNYFRKFYTKTMGELAKARTHSIPKDILDELAARFNISYTIFMLTVFILFMLITIITTIILRFIVKTILLVFILISPIILLVFTMDSLEGTWRTLKGVVLL